MRQWPEAPLSQTTSCSFTIPQTKSWKYPNAVFLDIYFFNFSFCFHLFQQQEIAKKKRKLWRLTYIKKSAFLLRPLPVNLIQICLNLFVMQPFRITAKRFHIIPWITAFLTPVLLINYLKCKAHVQTALHELV